MTTPEGRAGRGAIYLRLPEPLKLAVLEYSKRLGISQNAAVTILLRAGLGGETAMWIDDLLTDETGQQPAPNPHGHCGTLDETPCPTGEHVNPAVKP